MQLDPASFFSSHKSMPTSMNTKELVKLDPIIRQRAFFSATVECGKLLDGIRRFVQECIDEGCTEGEFLHRVNQWLRENAELLGEDYPTAEKRIEEWDPEDAAKYERSVRHIDSLARLRLIFRTQAEMCAGFSDFQRDMQPEQLDAYPAWQFVRNPGARTFRKDHVEHEGEIRLKNDFDWWRARNSPDFGGFDNPYPPFGFNSWMWTSPVSYAKCVDIGLLDDGEKVELTDEQRRTWGLDPEHAAEVITRMLDKLTKYPPEEPQKPQDAPEQGGKEQEPAKPAEEPQKGTQKPEYGYDVMDGYRKSKDRAEAIERSKKLVDVGGKVQFHDTITQAQIDEFNATVEHLLGKYKLGTLTGMGSGIEKDGVGAWVGGGTVVNLGGIALNNDRATGGVHGLKDWTPYDVDGLKQRVEKRKAGIEKAKKELEDLSPFNYARRWLLEDYIKDTEKRMKKELAMIDFGRHNVGVTKDGTTIHKVATHEFGHIINFRAYGGLYTPLTDEGRRAQTIIQDALKKARKPDKAKHKDIFDISQYANKNELEFFAECFTAREIGEKVPDYISKMLDDVIAIAQNTPKK